MYESRTFGDPTDTPTIERPVSVPSPGTSSTVSDSVSTKDSDKSKVEEGITVSQTMKKLFPVPRRRAPSTISNLGSASDS